MNPLRRKAEPPAVTPEPEPVELVKTPGAPKGRPTPKRRSAAAPATPAPRTRKEALAWQKEHGGRATVAGQKKLTPAEYRAALKAGDPNVLPRRDQGAIRALARDYVDSRRMASNYLLVLFPIYIVGLVIRPIQFLAVLLLLLMLVEWIITGSRLRKLGAERGIDTKEGSVSLGFYAGGRAYMPRKWRRPEPRVAMGDQI